MKVFFRKGRFPLLLLVVIGVFLNIFTHLKFPDSVIYLIMAAWWGVVFGWPLGAEFSFFAGTLVLFLSFLSAFFYKNPFEQFVPPERASVWFYLFFLSGVIQNFLESKEKSKATMDIWGLLGKLKDLKNIRIDKGTVPDNFNVRYFTQKLKPISQLTKIAVFIENLTIFLFKEMLNEFRRFLKIVFGFSGSLTHFLSKQLFKKIQNFLKNSIIIQKILKFPLIQLSISVLIFINIYKEIVFYRWFYKEDFSKILIRQILSRLSILWLVVFAVMVLLVVLRPKLNKALNGLLGTGNRISVVFISFLLLFLGLSGSKKEEGFVLKPNFIFGLFFLFILYFGDKYLFLKIRDNFEFRPYITEVYYDIASKYSEIIIYGHNFREMPFLGKVLINGNTQKIKEWDDDKIVVEIDPILSKTGSLLVVNDYGFGKNIKSNVTGFDYFDGSKATFSESKRFWQTLKEIAKNKSERTEQDE